MDFVAKPHLQRFICKMDLVFSIMQFLAHAFSAYIKAVYVTIHESCRSNVAGVFYYLKLQILFVEYCFYFPLLITRSVYCSYIFMQHSILGKSKQEYD